MDEPVDSIETGVSDRKLRIRWKSTKHRNVSLTATQKVTKVENDNEQTKIDITKVGKCVSVLIFEHSTT